MAKKLIKPIVYSDIEDKNILAKEMFKPLSSKESLEHALDLMDWLNTLRGKRPPHPDDHKYPGIILKFKK